MGVTTSALELRPVSLAATDGMVTANHGLAAEAGAAILEQGGNAIDAAVATAFAIPVVEPAMSGIGGRGYMVIHGGQDGESLVIDGHERAPRAARPDMFTVADDRPPPTQPTPGWGFQLPVVDAANSVGHLAVAVPGVVGALAVAHARYGRLPWRTVLRPAIALAADGFEVSVPLAVMIARHRDKLARFPATAEIFLPGGQPPLPGERLRQPDLAGTYELIAARGPGAFYRGELAGAIAREMARGNGILTAEDLAAFRPRVWDRPLTGTYRGHRLLTVPEATGGITLLEIMNILEGFELSALPALGATNLHLLIEAMRLAFRDRVAYVDDPAFGPVPFGGLGSKAYAAARRAAVRPDRAASDPEPGDPWPFDEAPDHPVPQGPTVAWPPSDGDTTHFCVVDRDRTVVSMTQSIIDAFGSGVVVPGTGMLLNSAMHNFNPLPRQRGSIAPWKRAAHYGSPALVLGADGRPLLAIGGAGGTMVPTGIAQILVNVLDRGWPIQDAVAAPRVHCEGWDTLVDARLDPAAVERLRELGHRLEVVRPGFAQPRFSRINGLTVDRAGVAWSGTDQFGDAGAAAPGARAEEGADRGRR